MGEAPAAAAQAREAASAAIELRLKQLDALGSVTAFAGDALRKYGQGPAALGWRISVLEDYTGARRDVTLVLPEDFPVAPPFVVVEPSAYLLWPHCERDGKLCLWVSGRAPVGTSPEHIVEHVFERIGRALQFALAGTDPAARREEFEREWLSYWPAANADKVRGGITILLLDVPEREVPLLVKLVIRPGIRPKSGHRVQHSWFPLALISSSAELLKRWTSRFAEFDSDKPQPIGLYAPILSPLPIGMPQSVDALRQFLSIDAGKLLDAAILAATPDHRPVWLILGAAYESGTALAGVALMPRVYARPPSSAHFRSHREARNAEARASVSWVPQTVTVMRADPTWMLDRNVNQLRMRLVSTRVLLVGCGALGSLVAEALVRAGVGHLTIVEPDMFDAANVGRHVLGATFIGQYKAEAMAHVLADVMPLIDVVPVLQQVQEAPPEVVDLNRFDLVVCTTADWPSELHLIAQRQSANAKAPLLLSWVEPHGVAGHGILSTSPTDNLQALFTSTGEYRFPLSEWPEGVAYRTLPACQATFQPAALLGIQPVATMVAGLATDYLFGLVESGQARSWWTDRKGVTQYGGSASALAGEVPESSMQRRELAALLAAVA